MSNLHPLIAAEKKIGILCKSLFSLFSYIFDDYGLKLMIAPNSSVGELHEKWTGAGVGASTASTRRHILDVGFRCRILLVKLLLKNKQRQKCPVLR